MGKLLKVLIAVFVVILLLIVGGLFALSPRESITRYDAGNFRSPSDYLAIKFKSSLSSSINSGEKNLVMAFDQDELNELLGLLYNDGMKNSSQALAEAFELKLKGDRGYFYVNSRLYNIVPTQYAFEMYVTGGNNNIIFNVDKAKAGIVPIPPKPVLSRLEAYEGGSFQIDPENQRVIVYYNMPQTLEIVSAEIKDDQLQIEIRIQVKSLEDLIEIIKAFVSGNMSLNIEEPVLDVLGNKYNDTISSGSMTLSQIRELMLLLGIK